MSRWININITIYMMEGSSFKVLNKKRKSTMICAGGIIIIILKRTPGVCSVVIIR